LVELWARDGGTFLKSIDIHNVVECYYQYSFKNPIAKPQRFEKKEVCYMNMNQASYELYGWSPLQSIQQVVQLLIHSTRYNKEFFEKNAIPDGLIALPNANQTQLDQFKKAWATEMKGKPHKLAFHNTDLKFERFSPTNKDMEWLDGQKWYMHLVFGAYGLSPTEAGFYEDANRATSESQERISVRNAIRPYLDMLERKVTNEILSYILKIEPRDLEIQFKFFPEDHVQENLEHKQDMELLDRKVISVNEIRAKKGLKPFDAEYADDPFMAQREAKEREEKRRENMDNFFLNQNKPIQNQRENERLRMSPEEKPEKPEGTKPKKHLYGDFIGKEIEINAGPEMVEGAETYEELLVNEISKWEKQVISAIEKSKIAQKSLKYVEKSFGDFLSGLFGIVFTETFSKKIASIIKKEMLKGLKTAENELHLDIGVSERFNNTVKYLANQQLDGYTIDGKKWHGIKGATNKLQLKIYDTVREGVQNKESQKQLVKRVKEVFKSAKEGQAVRIARTERNRFVNSGKLNGYLDSGVKGKKRWVTFHDDKTSDRCKKLDGQVRELTEEFETGDWSGMHPPSHPACRSSIEMYFD